MKNKQIRAQRRRDFTDGLGFSLNLRDSEVLLTNAGNFCVLHEINGLQFSFFVDQSGRYLREVSHSEFEYLTKQTVRVKILSSLWVRWGSTFYDRDLWTWLGDRDETSYFYNPSNDQICSGIVPPDERVVEACSDRASIRYTTTDVPELVQSWFAYEGEDYDEPSYKPIEKFLLNFRANVPVSEIPTNKRLGRNLKISRNAEPDVRRHEVTVWSDYYNGWVSKVRPTRPRRERKS